MSGSRTLEADGQLWERYSFGLKVEGLGVPRDTIKFLYLDFGFCTSRSSIKRDCSANWTAKE